MRPAAPAAPRSTEPHPESARFRRLARSVEAPRHHLAVSAPPDCLLRPSTAVHRELLFICRLACLPQVCHGKLLWIERMQMTRGDTTQHCHRLAPQDRRPRRRSWPIPAATQPARPILVYPPPPPPRARLFRTEKQLTAPADRPVRESAHAVAFTTVVAIRGAGSVQRRTGMQTARALAADSGRPGSQDPRLLLVAGQTHPRRCRSITTGTTRSSWA